MVTHEEAAAAAAVVLHDRAHIQNMSEAAYMISYWGYAERAMPCTSDAGSCEYLDVVYGAHETGMRYVGIIWSVIGAILFLWAFGRLMFPSPRTESLIFYSSSLSTEELCNKNRSSSDPEKNTSQYRPGGMKSAAAAATSAITSVSRAYLLPTTPLPGLFGRVPRYQLLILGLILTPLLILSHTGYRFQTWVTPVTGYPDLHNIRSSIGPWSDRVGVFAYALTPLSIMLSSRDSLLTHLTGLPYQNFNFLHRWLGYVILLQGIMHTIAWTVVETRLYQPQPSTGREWIAQKYMVWGVVAMGLLVLMVVMSLPFVVRRTGYEVFRKTHYVLAMLYIGACWGHWEKLKCFLLPSLCLWFVDRGARLVRMGLLHYRQVDSKGGMGFRCMEAVMECLPDGGGYGDVVRMEVGFQSTQDPWLVGQHFYVCFAEGGIWQSHPFTPLNVPQDDGLGVKHVYLFRGKSGETGRIAAMAAAAQGGKRTTPVILQGPYGDGIVEGLMPDVNVLCVAGGTGITYVLPVLLGLIQKPRVKDRKIELLWAVRRMEDTFWVEPELKVLRAAAETHGVEIHIFVTREKGSASSLSASEKEASGPAVVSGSESESCCCPAPGKDQQQEATVDVQKIGADDGLRHHPDLENLVKGFVGETVKGPTKVFASGPGGMISDLRSVVAACNSGSKVWKGDERFDVGLVCDDRLEW